MKETLEEKIQKNKEEARRLESEKIEFQWKKTYDEIISFLNKMEGKDFATANYGHIQDNGILIHRIVGVNGEKYYADCQGFYGQWTKKRFIQLDCISYTISAKYFHSKMYSGTSGNLIHNDEHPLEKLQSPIKLLEEGNGFPIGPRKSWSKAYSRIVDTGTYECHTSHIVFGEKSINQSLEGCQGFQESFLRFKTNICIIPDTSIFDKIHKTYLEQCIQSKKLMEDINSKKIDFIKGENF